MRRSELHKEIGGVADFAQQYRRIKREEANERNRNTPYNKTRRYRRDHKPGDGLVWSTEKNGYVFADKI